MEDVGPNDIRRRAVDTAISVFVLEAALTSPTESPCRDNNGGLIYEATLDSEHLVGWLHVWHQLPVDLDRTTLRMDVINHDIFLGNTEAVSIFTRKPFNVIIYSYLILLTRQI